MIASAARAVAITAATAVRDLKPALSSKFHRLAGCSMGKESRSMFVFFIFIDRRTSVKILP
jgi:hypothetical protein